VTAALPSLAGSVAQAYRDLLHAIRTLWKLAAIAFAILVANSLIQHILQPEDGTERLGLLVGFLFGAAGQFLLMPYYLAVHRLIILGEVTRSYRIAPAELGFQRFYWLSIAFDLLFLLPTIMAPALTFARVRYQLAFSVVVLLVIIHLFLRLITIFPAFAVGAPGATLKGAYADTKGWSWRILGIVVVAHLPFVLPLLALTTLLVRDQAAVRSWAMYTEIAVGAFGIILVTLLIVIASRLYMSIGHRTRGTYADPAVGGPGTAA
jgi:hypothetical protein